MLPAHQSAQGKLYLTELYQITADNDNNKGYSPSSGQHRRFWGSAVASYTYSDTQQRGCADWGLA